MTYQFGEFTFFPEQSSLYKNGQLLPLTSNQARLLGFFLSTPQVVHSKQTILQSVWEGKVVSEQAVFQNVSQLRQIFGNDVIKTFSKIGYQWQLQVNVVDISVETFLISYNAVSQVDPDSDLKKSMLIPANLTSSTTAKENGRNILGAGRGRILAAFLFIVLAGSYFVGDVYVQKKAEALHVIVNRFAAEADETLVEQTFVSLLNGNADLTKGKQVRLLRPVQALFADPLKVRADLGLNETTRLFWGKHYTVQGLHYYHFGLSQGKGYRQGFVYAQTKESLAKRLFQRVAEIEQQGYFALEADKMDIQALKQSLNRSPRDLELQLLLAKYYTNVSHYDVALTYLQQVLRTKPAEFSDLYHAEALLMSARIYQRRFQYELAQQFIAKAKLAYKKLEFWPGFFDVLKLEIWLHFAQTDYSKMFVSLESAINAGQLYADAITQFELHILYAVLAGKAEDEVTKYAQLNHAQVILLKYNLDESSQAVVYYHYALFAEDVDLGHSYLRKIIQLPRTSKNFWVQDNALEVLVNYYIEQKQFLTAHQLLEGNLSDALGKVLKAKVYLAQGNTSAARQMFVQAYDQSRLEYDIQTAATSALNLLKLSEEPAQQAEYSFYIRSNTAPSWLKQHKAEALLDKLML